MTDPLGELLAATDVLDKDGTKTTLGAFFAARPAALLFVRHFG